MEGISLFQDKKKKFICLQNQKKKVWSQNENLSTGTSDTNLHTANKYNFFCANVISIVNVTTQNQ